MALITVSSEHSSCESMPKPVSAATETVKAYMVNSRLQRKHGSMVWAVCSRTDFNHLKGG